MSIGQRRILSRRTVLVVDANVIPTLLMLKASKEVACPNGSKSPVAGHHHRLERLLCPFLPSFYLIKRMSVPLLAVIKRFIASAGVGNLLSALRQGFRHFGGSDSYCYSFGVVNMIYRNGFGYWSSVESPLILRLFHLISKDQSRRNSTQRLGAASRPLNLRTSTVQSLARPGQPRLPINEE